MHEIGGAHLQCVYNHYEKYEYKGKEYCCIYKLHKKNRYPLGISDEKNVEVQHPSKMKKKMKRAQYRRCTSSICEQSLGKVRMKRMKTFGVTIYTNLIPLKCYGDRRTDLQDGRSEVPNGPWSLQIYGVSLTIPF